MCVTSVANFKGGVGKTTTVINLGAALNNLGKKVLLIDMDPQANLSQSLGIGGDMEHSIYTVLRREAFGEPGTKLTDALITASGIDVIPSSLDLANAELELASVYGREKILSQLLKPLKQYDYILIDCPPSMSLLTVNALVGSDMVLIPLQAEFLPLKGARNFLKHFDQIKKLNKRLKLMGFLLTKYDARKKMNRQVREELEKEFTTSLVFNSRIRTNISLANAQENGQDIFRYDKRSHGAADYAALTKEFLSRISH